MADPTNSWDPVWEKVFRSQEWGKYPPEQVIRFVARNWYTAADRTAVRLLDLGCGPGACTWFMAREGFAVSAIDGSATAIEKLRRRLEGEGLRADARVGDYVQLPWPTETFDGVIDNVSLCTNRMRQCHLAVAEVFRVLKPGGRFYSANFTPRTWGFGDGDLVEPNGYENIREGPLAGKGFNLFLDSQQIGALYRPFADVSIETASWTANNMSKLVELWIVTCRKPG